MRAMSSGSHQSLHGYALGEIAWFINVAAQFNGQMICEELKRDDIQDGHHVVGRFRQHHDEWRGLSARLAG